MGYGEFRANVRDVASYTLQASVDHTPNSNNILEMTHSSPSTVVIPLQSAFDGNFPVGAQILIEQVDATVTIQAAPGVTLYVPGGNYSTSGYNSQILLTKVGDDSWLLANHAPMFTSFQEMIEALNCIYAVGFGLERDTNRSGDYQYIRVEPITHFYDDTLTIMDCPNVDSVETDTQAGEAISIFKTGYSKWEAEEANGLDEFLSAGNTAPRLSTLRKTLDKQCKYIASGYASRGDTPQARHQYY
jgi:hypothetical protein